VDRPETYRFGDDGGIPNSSLPVLVYHDVEQAARGPSDCRELFASNGWIGAWRDGIFSFHHFHSTAHEVLGIVSGSAAVVLGGPSGRRFDSEPSRCWPPTRSCEALPAGCFGRAGRHAWLARGLARDTKICG
jgi:uncharacterized protein YjlB